VNTILFMAFMNWRPRGMGHSIPGRRRMIAMSY
jgi:hypothetical protein